MDQQRSLPASSPGPRPMASLAPLAVLALLLAGCNAAEGGPEEEGVRVLQLGHQPQAFPEAGTRLPPEAMEAALVDQRGKPTSLAAEQGRVRVVSFFYRCCNVITMCPQLTATISDASGRIGPEEREHVRVFLVSFDPERDTPELLAEYGNEIQADSSFVVLATGPKEEVETLAGACGVWFLPDADEIAHNMRTVVLDRDGVVSAVFRGAQFEAGDLLASILKEVRAER